MIIGKDLSLTNKKLDCLRMKMCKESSSFEKSES